MTEKQHAREELVPILWATVGPLTFQQVDQMADAAGDHIIRRVKAHLENFAREFAGIKALTGEEAAAALRRIQL